MAAALGAMVPGLRPLGGLAYRCPPGSRSLVSGTRRQFHWCALLDVGRRKGRPNSGAGRSHLGAHPLTRLCPLLRHKPEEDKVGWPPILGKTGHLESGARLAGSKSPLWPRLAGGCHAWLKTTTTTRKKKQIKLPHCASVSHVGKGNHNHSAT